MSTERTREIEEQLAHLRWKRLQNDREIKLSLESTRSLMQKDSVLQISTDKAGKFIFFARVVAISSALFPGERAVWMNAIVQDELSRPLVVEDYEMAKIQEEEDGTKAAAIKVLVLWLLKFLLICLFCVSLEE